MIKNQNGFSVIKLLVIISMATAVMFGYRLAPSYIQSRTIEAIFKDIVKSHSSERISDNDIRSSFDRYALAKKINVITSADIDIDRQGPSFTLSADYEIKQKLAGNASVLITFHPSASN